MMHFYGFYGLASWSFLQSHFIIDFIMKDFMTIFESEFFPIGKNEGENWRRENFSVEKIPKMTK